MKESHRHERRVGGVGWGFIGAFVLTWDLLAPQTLSDWVNQEKQKHPVLVMAMIGGTAAHLAGVIPEPVDPFKQFIKHVPHRS